MFGFTAPRGALIQMQNDEMLETLARDHLLKIGLSLMKQMLSAIAILS